MRTHALRSTVSHLLLSLLLSGSAAVSAWAQPAWASPTPPASALPGGNAATAQIPALKDAGIDQKLDNPVPPDLPFVDEAGREVRIGDYFGTRPVILVLAYYECPVLCTQIIHAVASSMGPLSFNAGEDFEVVVVSFDPGETPSMAKAKRDDFVRRYARDATGAGIHFLTGRQSSITALTDAVGFRYTYDEKIDQYAHPAVVTILTSEGHVSRYLFGIEYAPRDLRLALVEAGDNKIGNVVDSVLLFCYNYDPATGRYGFAIMSAIRLGGLLTLGGLGAFILVTLRRDRRRGSAAESAATGTR